MDAQWLKDNVGDVLSTGVTAVILANPADPVEYLAHWLLKQVETTTRHAAVIDFHS